jgi:hypothetical protein
MSNGAAPPDTTSAQAPVATANIWPRWRDICDEARANRGNYRDLFGCSFVTLYEGMEEVMASSGYKCSAAFSDAEPNEMKGVAINIFKARHPELVSGGPAREQQTRPESFDVDVDIALNELIVTINRHHSRNKSGIEKSRRWAQASETALEEAHDLDATSSMTSTPEVDTSTVGSKTAFLPMIDGQAPSCPNNHRMSSRPSQGTSERVVDTG